MAGRCPGCNNPNRSHSGLACVNGVRRQFHDNVLEPMNRIFEGMLFGTMDTATGLSSFVSIASRNASLLEYVQTRLFHISESSPLIEEMLAVKNILDNYPGATTEVVE